MVGPPWIHPLLQVALHNKTVTEADGDQALLQTFTTLILLRYFDPPEHQIYRNLTRLNINTSEAQKLALKSAQESIVLLKNSNKKVHH